MDVDVEVIVIAVVLGCEVDREREDVFVHREDKETIVDEEEFVAIN